MSSIKNLSYLLRRKLDANTKAQFEAGLIDEKLQITDLGKNVLHHIAREQFEEAFTARANEIIADTKEEEAKNK